MYSETKHTKTENKIKIFFEIIICFLIVAIATILVNLADSFLQFGERWIGILAYLVLCATLIFYVLKIEKAPLSSIGLKKLRLQDIPAGLLLGLIMFAAQQLPLLLMKMDYSAYAMAPDPAYMITTVLYCFLGVGFAEELIFRGFILHKSLALCHSKTVAVIINILLFYAIHWSSMQFIFGELYNISINVIILCAYFFCSKNKSLTPLIIAHGFYDTLTSVLLPLFLSMALP